MNINKTSIYHILSLILFYLIQSIALAETRIAILEFELLDVTLAPRIPSEIKRTASIKPLLETELILRTVTDADFYRLTIADSSVAKTVA